MAILLLLFMVQRYGPPRSVARRADHADLVPRHRADGRRPDRARTAHPRGDQPGYALRFLAGHGKIGFSASAVSSSRSPGWRLYADMGHFGKRPIRLAFFTLVLPALLLNYLGQGALLLGILRAIENPFYLLAQRWALYPCWSSRRWGRSSRRRPSSRGYSPSRSRRCSSDSARA